MARLTIKWTEIEDALPGFKSLWKEIKAETHSRVRSPRSVELSDKPERMCPDDSSCCRRFAVDLTGMRIVRSIHVSAGEWACHGSNRDEAVDEIPNGAALVDCEWNDYYRMFSIRVQVREGAISTKLLAEKAGA